MLRTRSSSGGDAWVGRRSLLALLVQQQGKVVTKDQIHAAWHDESEVGAGNAIEVYVHRLRRKTEGAGIVIRTIRGIGYLLEADWAN